MTIQEKITEISSALQAHADNQQAIAGSNIPAGLLPLVTEALAMSTKERLRDILSK